MPRNLRQLFTAFALVLASIFLTASIWTTGPGLLSERLGATGGFLVGVAFVFWVSQIQE